MKSLVMIMTNETGKGLRLLLNYRFNTLSELVMMALIFVGLGFFMGQGRLDPQQLAPTLLGYLIWYFAMIAIAEMSHTLVEEAQAGTLEQSFMSPAPFGLILLGRSFAMLFTATVQIGLVGLALILVLRIPFPIRLEALPVFALTMAGLFGFGFMIAGLALVFKHVKSFANLAMNMLIFLNGALLPVTVFPSWLETISRALPSTQGIAVLRSVILNGQSLAAVWADGSLVLLAVHSLVYFAAGWFFLSQCVRIARQRGSLGQY